MLSLKAARKAKKITQEQLAKTLGVSRSTVSMWEIGASDPDTETIHRLADLLDCTTDYLLGRSARPLAAETSRDGAADDPDGDIWELRERLRRQPGLRVLFSATQKATQADMLKAVRIIEALKSDEDI